LPVDAATAKNFTDLGIAGAALLLILVVVILLFAMQSRSIDKLCKKIDLLITHNSNETNKLNEVLISNDKDQKTLIKLLTNILELVTDISKRTIRMDERTFFCLGDKNKEE
jgi:low affinity Fe/Cu permease